MSPNYEAQMPFYTAHITKVADARAVASVYSLVVEALNEALVFDDEALRGAITELVREFRNSQASAEGDLRELGA